MANWYYTRQMSWLQRLFDGPQADAMSEPTGYRDMAYLGASLPGNAYPLLGPAEVVWPKKLADDIRDDIAEALKRPVHHTIAAEALQAPIMADGSMFFETRDTQLIDDISDSFAFGRAFNVACDGKLYMVHALTELSTDAFRIDVVSYPEIVGVDFGAEPGHSVKHRVR